jgi:trigger factor
MAKNLSPLAKRKKKEKRKKLLKIGIPTAIGVLVLAVIIWYSCYLFGWVSYTPLQVVTGKNKPYCELGEYKGLEYTQTSTELTDEDYEDYYSDMLEDTPYYHELAERANTLVRDGDILNIDYVGKVDGEVFDGGSAEGAYLEIGSDTFVDGFEDSLIGETVGTTVDVYVTFPDSYYENLAGKDAVFTVTINYVAEKLSEVDDTYIAENTDYDTKDGYEEGYLTAYLSSTKISDARETNYSEILNQIIAGTKFYNLDAEIEAYYTTLYNYYTSIAESYNTTLETYVYYTLSESLDTFESELNTFATVTIKEKYAVEAIAKKEKLKVTDDIYNSYIEQVAEENSCTVSELETNNEKSEIKEMVLTDYVLDTCIKYGTAK